MTGDPSHPYAVLMRQDEFNARSIAALQRVCAADGNNADALRRLGDAFRRLGDFPAARESYDRLCVLRPGCRSAAWLRAITGGDRLPSVPPATVLRAAPFLHIRDFLDEAEAAGLRTWANAARERFVDAAVERGQGGALIAGQRGLSVPQNACADVRAWYVPKLRALLPRVLTALRLDELAGCRISLVVAAYPDGAFGIPHCDYPPLTGVCYFHREPRTFAGGDLLLYDSDGLRGGTYDTCSFSRIKPVANSIVFYRGSHPHEVTPVACDPDDFASGRFSVLTMCWLPTQHDPMDEQAALD